MRLCGFVRSASGTAWPARGSRGTWQARALYIGLAAACSEAALWSPLPRTEAAICDDSILVPSNQFIESTISAI